MIPYVFILILFLIGFYSKNKKPYFVLCALSMLLLVALRAENVGPDTQNYIRFFEEEKVTHITEPLWEYYMLFVKSLTDNPQIFLASTAFITLIPLFLLIKKKSSYALLALFVYFILPNDQGYIFTMTGMRQAMAATIVMFMFLAYEKRKWLIAVLLAVAAFSIHNSSIIAVIGLLIMSFVKINQKTGIVLLVISTLLMILSVSVSDMFSLFQNTSLLQMAFMEDYSSYATYMVGEYRITFVRTLFLVIPIIMMIVLLLLNPTVLETIYARLYILGGVFVCIMSQVPMVSRYFLYFILTEVFLVPQIYNCSENNNNKRLCIILIVIQSLLLFWYLFINYRNGLDWSVRRVAPYYFYFNTPYNSL